MTEQWWVPHKAEVFLPGRLIRSGAASNVYQTDIGEVEVPAKEHPEQILSAQVFAGVNDVCTLDSVTDASLLHTVRTRYVRDDIYTNISRILIAVNPFKSLSIYHDQYIEQYSAATDPAQLPPHIFGLGADVFQRLTDDSRSQAVLISGESGAGKTESTKLVLLYISQAFSRAGESRDGFEDKLLEINPILEAFGNAKTGRNNNSSRFGKWIEVLVNPVSMSLCGASVTDYLLEITRVCGQGPGERNYHIFYQLALDAGEDLEDLQLSAGPEKFAYLNKNPAHVDALNDREDFDNLRKAIAGLQFTAEEQDHIFKITAGILHLGNMTFVKNPDATKVADGGVLDTVATLFGVPPPELSKVLVNKRLVVGKDVTISPVGDDKAANARDSIAKLVYSRLFKWLIARCNQALGTQLHLSADSAAKSLPFIGVLDIAGFESFAKNSLEQLFINLSNEKLQQFFNTYVFKSELTEYAAEGLSVAAIEFSDNTDILTLIEGKGGILPILDDATTGVRQTDSTFAAQVVKAHEKNPRFVKTKFSTEPKFTIKHFAGDVQYDCEGFLEKNVAQQPPEVLELMATSSMAVMRLLAVEPEVEAPAPKAGAPAAKAGPAGAKPGGGASKRTLSTGFRKSLQQLVDKFADARAHFIRCVKPNMEKVPTKFNSAMVIEQMRLSGVMEAVKIRKAGYPIRQVSLEFVKRYVILVPRAQRAKLREMSKGGQEGSLQAGKALLEALAELLVGKVKDTEYAIGKTKVFLRDSLYRTLENYRRLAFAQPVVQIQAFFRGFRLRNVMREAKDVAKALRTILDGAGISPQGHIEGGNSSVLQRQGRATVMESTLTQLDIMLKRAESLPVRLPIFQHMLKARARIAAESNLARQMQTLAATGSVDIPAMEAVLARSADYSMSGEVVDALVKRCATLRGQVPHEHALKGCPLLDLEEVRRRIEDATQAGLNVPEAWLLPEGAKLFAEAVARLEQLEEEKRQMEEARRKAEEEEAMRKAAEEAAEKAAKLEAERLAAKEAADQAAGEAKEAIRILLARGVEELNAQALQEAFLQAEEQGIPEGEFRDAHKVFLDLQSGDFVQSQLARLRRSGGTTPSELLIKANLAKQLEVLGLNLMPRSQEMREVASQMVSSRPLGAASAFDSQDPNERRVAEECFEDLTNFSRLCDPMEWGPQDLRPSYQDRVLAKADGTVQPELPAMLRWTGDRIFEPLTVIEDEQLSHAAIRNFTNVMRCMGDKPAAKIGNKELPVLMSIQRTPALRDEIYIQVMKQLTDNPSVESEVKGWRLFKSISRAAVPSAELCEFVRAFLERCERGSVCVRKRSATSGTRSRSESVSSIAAARRRSTVTELNVLKAEVSELVRETKKIFQECTERVYKKQAIKRRSATPDTLLQVFSEDGQSYPVTAAYGWKVEELHEHMVKLLRLQGGEDFEVFLMDPKETCPAWRMLPRTTTCQEAAQAAAASGRKVLFGRVNVRGGEDLVVEDLVHARLTFQHAVRQFLGYEWAWGDAEEVLPTIGAALVAVDRALFGQKKAGKGHVKFNERVDELQAELDAGLLGEGVLERYLPAALIANRDRAELAKKVMEALGGSGGSWEPEASFELLAKSRALTLMQAKLPAFEAYVWKPVSLVSDFAGPWRDLQWATTPSQVPEGPFPPAQELLSGGQEHKLAVSPEGVELRSLGEGQGLVLPLSALQEQWYLNGWASLPGDQFAVSLLNGSAGAIAPQGAVFQMPEGAADSATALLARFDNEASF